MGFDFLRRISKCEGHGVILCSTAEVKNLHDVELKATNSDPTKQALMNIENSFDRIVVEKCMKASFVIVPISDGYEVPNAIILRGGRADHNTLKGVRTDGSHWAALVIDCRNKNALQGRLLDSLCSTRFRATRYNVLRRAYSAV
jgi:hypothetical protein